MNGEQLLGELSDRISVELSSSYRARGMTLSAKIDSVAEMLPALMVGDLRAFALASEEDWSHSATLKTYDFGNELLQQLRRDAPARPAPKGFEWMRRMLKAAKSGLGMELRARA